MRVNLCHLMELVMLFGYDCCVHFAVCCAENYYIVIAILQFVLFDVCWCFTYFPDTEIEHTRTLAHTHLNSCSKRIGDGRSCQYVGRAC